MTETATDAPSPETTPQAGEDPEGQEPTTTSPEPAEPKAEPAKDEKYLAQLREEAAKSRKEKKAAEDELKQLKDAQLSEHEKAQKQAKEATERAGQLESELRETRVTIALNAEAQRQGLKHPEMARSLVSDSEIVFDDDGQPENAEELVKGVLEKYPDLGKSEGDDRPTNLKQVLKDGEPVVEDGKPLEGDAARELFKRDEEKFHELMDKGLIRGV